MNALHFWSILHCHADALTRVEQARGDWEGEEGECGKVGCLPLQQVRTLVGEQERAGDHGVDKSGAQL